MFNFSGVWNLICLQAIVTVTAEGRGGVDQVLPSFFITNGRRSEIRRGGGAGSLGFPSASAVLICRRDCVMVVSSSK